LQVPDTIIDASITKYRTSEREMAKQHINVLNNKKLITNSIVIFDRGYPSYDMFDYLNDRNLFFLMRVSSSFKLTTLYIRLCERTLNKIIT
jgi:hypothetical protein